MLNNYSRIRLTTPHYESEGVPLGSIGYLIETYSDGGAYEVEFSAPDGTTIAQLVLNDSEVPLAELPVPVKDGRVLFTSATQRIAEGQGIPHEEFWREAKVS